jgi:hypothetical protein
MHTKQESVLCAISLSLSLASGGCDDQVEPGYYGESLLTVTGSVEIANRRTRGPLSPALGFRDQVHSTITLVDLPVHGTFPSDFRIELYEPPPEETLYHPTRQEEGEPLASIGYITAVTSDHPDKLYTGNSLSTIGHDCQDEGRPDNLCLSFTHEICVEPNLDNVPCYVEKHYCPLDNPKPDPTLCTIEASGNAELKSGDVLRQFAGLSQNYQVVYLAGEAPPGSATAALLEAEAGVPAGYGLYEVTEGIPGEEAERCDEAGEVSEVALRLYNEANGTHYKSLNCRAADADAPHCRMPSADFDGRTGPGGELRRIIEKAKIELGCPIGDSRYKRVEDPANTPISIVIDADQPIGP